MKKISIIIPVYGVEQYIIRCLDSILRQDIDDIELIIVDDCSTDKSMKLVKQRLEVADIDVIYVKHDVNRGLSAARNSGINVATGEYLYFLDSDDALKEKSLDLFKNAIDEYNCDCIIGNYEVISNTGGYVSKRYADYCEYCDADVFRAYADGWIPTMAWNKLIKREFICQNSLFFAEGILHEDELWSFMVMIKASKVRMLGNTTYEYYVREGSIMTDNNINIRKFNSLIEILRQMVSFSRGVDNLIVNCYMNRFVSKCHIHNYMLQSIGIKERWINYLEVRKAEKQIVGLGSGIALKVMNFGKYLPKYLGFVYNSCVYRAYMHRLKK